jgi:hypothetical protein
MTIEELSDKIEKLENLHSKALRLYIDNRMEYRNYIQYVSVIEGLQVRAIERYCNNAIQYKGIEGSLPLYTITKVDESIRIPYMVLSELSHSLICHICDSKELNEMWGKVIIG